MSKYKSCSLALWNPSPSDYFHPKSGSREARQFCSTPKWYQKHASAFSECAFCVVAGSPEAETSVSSIFFPNRWMNEWLHKINIAKINWVEFNSFTCCLPSKYMGFTVWVYFLDHCEQKTNTTVYCLFLRMVMGCWTCNIWVLSCIGTRTLRAWASSAMY